MAKPRVLVIDDDKTIADTFVMVLNVSGFEAKAAYSGEEGLQLSRDHGFEFLVSDVVMHPMNGIEAAIEIRKLLPTCRVLLISGTNDTTSLLAEATSRGFEFDILPKPVNPTALIEALKED
ncbi:response regulator [Telmatobacter sp. DSM 110680]|uniref:Response regulator n=1 Tax=Telmatobacter sp. DSM 110680 TaxID=3036704 RepID=A0AAU7DJX0_9BACT